MKFKIIIQKQNINKTSNINSESFPVTCKGRNGQCGQYKDFIFIILIISTCISHFDFPPGVIIICDSLFSHHVVLHVEFSP